VRCSIDRPIHGIVPDLPGDGQTGVDMLQGLFVLQGFVGDPQPGVEADRFGERSPGLQCMKGVIDIDALVEIELRTVGGRSDLPPVVAPPGKWWYIGRFRLVGGKDPAPANTNKGLRRKLFLEEM
jgi:hypothetical protein